MWLFGCGFCVVLTLVWWRVRSKEGFGDSRAITSGRRQSGLTESLNVAIVKIEWSEKSTDGSRQGTICLVVTNQTTESIEQVCVTVRGEEQGKAVECVACESYTVDLAPGESTSIDMKIPSVCCEPLYSNRETVIEVVGARRVERALPTFILPEGDARHTAIEEVLPVTTDFVVEKIKLTVRRKLFTSSGQVRIEYVAWNCGDVPKPSVACHAKILSNSGDDVSHHRVSFDILPTEKKKILMVLNLADIRDLAAARFDTTFSALEEFAFGASLVGSSHEGTKEDREPVKEWEGEEIQHHTWYGHQT